MAHINNNSYVGRIDNAIPREVSIPVPLRIGMSQYSIPERVQFYQDHYISTTT